MKYKVNHTYFVSVIRYIWYFVSSLSSLERLGRSSSILVHNWGENDHNWPTGADRHGRDSQKSRVDHWIAFWYRRFGFQVSSRHETVKFLELEHGSFHWALKSGKDRSSKAKPRIYYQYCYVPQASLTIIFWCLQFNFFNGFRRRCFFRPGEVKNARIKKYSVNWWRTQEIRGKRISCQPHHILSDQ
jgi:hypothetical protein